ncbi:hypothetical protein NSQ26_04655 [Bacillus sp. FSL W7-1360]
MDIRDVGKVLNAIGEKTVYVDGRLEQVPSPYEDYYLLKEEKGKWEYGVFKRYMKNTPYFQKEKTFDTREEGSRFFFLDRLSSYYSLTVVHPLLARKDLHIYDDTFDVSKLRYALSVAGVSKDLFYVDQKPSHRAVVLESKGTDCIISFFGTSGNKVSSSLPLELHRALFFTFQSVVKLHLFETEVSMFLKQENVAVTFTDEEIDFFIS